MVGDLFCEYFKVYWGLILEILGHNWRKLVAAFRRKIFFFEKVVQNALLKLHQSFVEGRSYAVKRRSKAVKAFVKAPPKASAKASPKASPKALAKASSKLRQKLHQSCIKASSRFDQGFAK